MLEIYRGNANTWECDENGHLNVRFYVVKAEEALAHLSLALGLTPEFFRQNGTELTVTDHHIRFLREVHAGGALMGRGGVVSTDGAGAAMRVYIELVNAFSGEVAATFNTVVTHHDPDTEARISFPREALARARDLTVPLPDHAAPRSLHLEPPSGLQSWAKADELGLLTINKSVVRPIDAMPSGRMSTDGFIGKVSDGAVNLFMNFRPDRVDPELRGKIGGAVLEYRLVYLKRPRLCDLIEIRSGLAAFESKVQKLVHWTFDAATQEPLATAEAVAISMDLTTRRSLALPGHVRDKMQDFVVEGLAL
jgi:acyl-CoA thioester hydrolase